MRNRIQSKHNPDCHTGVHRTRCCLIGHIIVAFLARKRHRRIPKTSVEEIPTEYPTDQKMAFENRVVEN